MMLHLVWTIVAVLSTASCPYGPAGRPARRLEASTIASNLPEVDLARAQKPHPSMGSEVLASRMTVSETLNKWLFNNVANAHLKPCATFQKFELNAMLADLIGAAHPKLNALYTGRCGSDGGCDRRALRHKSLAEYEDEWKSEDALLSAHGGALRAKVYAVIRDGKCYEAVSMFYHQLTAESRAKALAAGLMVPLLPAATDLKSVSQLLAAPPPEEAVAPSTEAPHRHLSPFGGENPIYSVHAPAWAEMKESLQQWKDAENVRSGREVPNITETYSDRSPCQIAHQLWTEPWDNETARLANVSDTIRDEIKKNSFSKRGVADGVIPDTIIPATGYVDCNKPETCMGGDRNYRIEAVVRTYLVPGSGKIMTATNDYVETSTPISPNATDVLFRTRTFEGSSDSPSKFGPAYAGGDGTAGLLGPAL